MGAHHGNEGDLMVGANPIANSQGWNYDDEQAVDEVTSIGDTVAAYIPSGLTKGGGSIEVLWDEVDTTGQGALVPGASVVFNGYPEGNVSGDVYFTGTIYITNRGLAITKDGITTRTFTYVGVLTESAVV